MAVTIGDKSYYPLHGVRGRKVVVLPITFTPNGSGTVTVTNKQAQRGLVSAVRTGTGAFTLTLFAKYASLISWNIGVRTPSGTPTDGYIIGTPNLNGANGATIPIVLAQAGTPADVSADPNAEVSVTLWLSKTSLESER